MKLSEITMEHLSQWCHVQQDDVRLPGAWAAAKEAVISNTGLDEETADEYEDLTFAAIALSADMIYNTGYHVDNDKINKVVESFIGLHTHNLLPGGASSQ